MIAYMHPMDNKVGTFAVDDESGERHIVVVHRFVFEGLRIAERHEPRQPPPPRPRDGRYGKQWGFKR